MKKNFIRIFIVESPHYELEPEIVQYLRFWPFEVIIGHFNENPRLRSKMSQNGKSDDIVIHYGAIIDTTYYMYYFDAEDLVLPF